jgi:hypothetical protein
MRERRKREVRVGGPTEDRHVLEQKKGKRQRYRETFGFTKIFFLVSF